MELGQRVVDSEGGGFVPGGTFFDVSRNCVTITIEYPAMKSRSKSHRCSTYGRLVRRDRYAKNFGIRSVTNGSAQICSEKLLSNSFVYGCGLSSLEGGGWGARAHDPCAYAALALRSHL